MLTFDQIVNWIVAFTTPIFLAHSSYGVYFLFGGACLFTAAVCVLFMPETRGKTLEDIDASFRRSGRKSFISAEDSGEDSHIPSGSKNAGFVTSSLVI